eukprot:5957042-Pyramimonas_sp.AAC.1
MHYASARGAGGRSSPLTHAPRGGPQVELLGGYDPCEACADVGERAHADTAIGAAGRALCGGPDVCEGCAEAGEGAHADPPVGATGRAPYRARSAAAAGSMQHATVQHETCSRQRG